MSTTPRVTVVLTVHNRVRYLGEALQGALSQRLGEFEVVVAHDGDGEDVRALVAACDDPRVRYRRNAGRPGIVDSLLGAVADSRAPYLAVLNDDDVWEPDFLARLVPALDGDPGVSVAFCGQTVIGEAGAVDPEATEHHARQFHHDSLAPGLHRPFWDALVERSVQVAMGAVLRRDAVDWDDFPAEVTTSYDHWLAYLACRDGMGAVFVPDRLVRYRVHAGMATFRRTLTAPGVTECLRRMIDDPRVPERLHGALRRRLQWALVGWATELVAQGRGREARGALARARALGPSGPRARITRGLATLPAPVGRQAVAMIRRGQAALRG